MSDATWSFDPELVGAEPPPAAPWRPAREPCDAPADYAGLLHRVLARTGVASTPVLQFLPCHGASAAPEIAKGLALCAADSLGRTLRVVAAGPNGAVGAAFATERDPYVPALHHARLEGGIFDRNATEQPVATWLKAASHAFRLVAIDCAATSASAEGLALAPLCSGTILLVQAGRTRLADVQATAAELVQAGGTVLGTVLARVPCRLPRWLLE